MIFPLHMIPKVNKKKLLSQNHVNIPRGGCEQLDQSEALNTQRIEEFILLLIKNQNSIVSKIEIGSVKWTLGPII